MLGVVLYKGFHKATFVLGDVLFEKRVGVIGMLAQGVVARRAGVEVGQEGVVLTSKVGCGAFGCQQKMVCVPQLHVRWVVLFEDIAEVDT